MIGVENLLKYWPMGLVREEYVRDAKHWYKLIGYYDKHGYFDHKGIDGEKGNHQGTLPEWALDYHRIHRTDSKRKPREEKPEEQQEKPPKYEDSEPKDRPKKTYRDRLDLCGASTKVKFTLKVKNKIYTVYKILSIPYNVMKKKFKDFVYEKGVGIVGKFTRVDFHLLMCEDLIYSE